MKKNYLLLGAVIGSIGFLGAVFTSGQGTGQGSYNIQTGGGGGGGTNVSIKILSASGGGNAVTDAQNGTPDFEGQVGQAWFNSGSKAGWLYVSRSKNQGDWTNSFSFPTSIEQIGYSGVNEITHAATGYYPSRLADRVRVMVNNGPTGWASVADGGWFLENYSTNDLNPGSGWGGAIMVKDTSTKLMFALDGVGGATLVPHLATNGPAKLIPGNGGIVWNPYADGDTPGSMRGFWIGPAATPGGYGLTSGNYAMTFYDCVNYQFRIPKWVSGVFQPITAGWLDTFNADPFTGIVKVPYSLTTSNLTVTNTLTVSGITQLTGNSNYVSRLDFTGSAPTAVTNGGNGTGGSILISGTDSRGFITLTAGSALVASTNVFTVTFNRPFNTTPSVFINAFATNGSPSANYIAYSAFNSHIIVQPSTTGFVAIADSTGISSARPYYIQYRVDGN